MIHTNLSHFNCSGIYIIRNITNNKVYVGSAKNIRQRLHEHKSMLRNNKHSSKYLQNAYNLDSKKFLFSILECVSIENLIKREQYWLDFFRCFNKLNGYNNVPIAYSSLGRKFSEETKEKIRQSHLGMKKPWSTMNHFKKPIIHILNDIETYYSYIGEASASLNISRNTITRLLNHPVINSKHGQFKYV